MSCSTNAEEDKAMRQEVGKPAISVTREQKVTLYELFLRQPEGGYRRYVRWDGQEKWLPTGPHLSMIPYQGLPL